MWIAYVVCIIALWVNITHGIEVVTIPPGGGTPVTQTITLPKSATCPTGWLMNKYTSTTGIFDCIPIGSITDDQTASEVPFTPFGSISSTNVQSAIQELLNEIPPATDNQIASEVPFSPIGNISSTNVQTAIQELDTEKITVGSLHTIATSGDYDDLINQPQLATTQSCVGTDKFRAYNATTGAFTCAADEEGVGGGDSDAIHDNVAGEIDAVTAKTTTVCADIFIIEDSQASFAKKKATICGLATAISTVLQLQNLQGAVTDAQVPDNITITLAATASALTNGDRGDISVASNVHTIDPDVVSNTKLANMSQATIKGRAVGAGTGDPVDLTAAQAADVVEPELLLQNIGGAVTDAQVPDTITVNNATSLSNGDKGDFTASGGVHTLDSDVVSNAKLANMAVNTIKGRISSGTGDPEDLSASQARTVMGVPALAGESGYTGLHDYDGARINPPRGTIAQRDAAIPTPVAFDIWIITDSASPLDVTTGAGDPAFVVPSYYNGTAWVPWVGRVDPEPCVDEFVTDITDEGDLVCTPAPTSQWSLADGVLSPTGTVTCVKLGNAAGAGKICVDTNTMSIDVDNDDDFEWVFTFSDPDSIISGSGTNLRLRPGQATGTIILEDSTGTACLTFDVDSSGGGTVTQGTNCQTLSLSHHIKSGYKAVTKSTATSYTIGTTDPRELYGGVIYVTGAATITVPAIADGMNFTVITIGAVAVSVDMNAADRMILDGTALDDGDKATNTSTTGDMLVCSYESAAGLYCASGSNDGDLWIDGGA